MERIGSYSVVRKLGEGGMGKVWLARSRGGRLVAVKVARTELAGDPAFRERFRAEVAAARSVGGFHTAQVVDADAEAAAPWLATAYVPGPTLSQLVAAEGPMDEERLLGLGAALAEALQAVHRCGLVHRDLKPGNIIMAEDGPRVLDFGISRAVDNTRLTVTGTAFGTPGFLAPEQAEGLDVGPAADVFALGAVLVAAAGGSAFGGGSPVALMYRSVHQEADLTAVPEALRPMIAACLEKEPGRRPSTEQLLDWFSPAEGDAPAALAAATAPDPAPAPGPSADPGPQQATPATPATPAAPVARTGRAPDAYELAPPAHPLTPTAAPSSPSSPAPPATPAAPRVPPPMPGYAPAALPPSPYAPAALVANAPPDGPEFLAMDRKNAVVADPDGISLGTNGRVAEFPWSGIDRAWCERGKGRGNVLVVTLALPDGSVHSCEVGTRHPVELDAWRGQFTAVVGYYLPSR